MLVDGVWRSRSKGPGDKSDVGVKGCDDHVTLHECTTLGDWGMWRPEVETGVGMKILFWRFANTLQVSS